MLQSDIAGHLSLTVQSVSNALSYSSRHYFSLLRTAQVADLLKTTVADLATPDKFPYLGPDDQREQS